MECEIIKFNLNSFSFCGINEKWRNMQNLVFGTAKIGYCQSCAIMPLHEKEKMMLEFHEIVCIDKKKCDYISAGSSIYCLYLGNPVFLFAEIGHR